MKSKLWYYRFQGSVYANGPVRFNKLRTKAQVRRHVQIIAMEGKPLPRGTEIWPTTEEDVRMVGECK